MKLVKKAQAGSLESCDILVTVDPGKPGSGFVLNLDSPAKLPFGELIENEIKEIVSKYQIDDIIISAVDKGALGYCIKARTETAIKRALGKD